MHCTSCGAAVREEATFCGECGKANSTSAPANVAPTSNSGLQSNVAGGLCYAIGFITGIIFLMAEPYKRDRFVRFHAFHAIFLSVLWLAIYLALGSLSAILPFGLWQIMWMLHSLLGLAFFVLWVVLIYKAYNNEQFKLPVIGDLAAKQA